MKRVYAVSLLMIVTLLMALGSGVPVYYRVFFLTSLVLVFGLVWALLSVWRLGVGVDRTFGKLRVGERMESQIAVRSGSPLPKFGLEVRELSEMPGHNTAAVINLPPFGEAYVKAQCASREARRLQDRTAGAGRRRSVRHIHTTPQTARD